MSEARRKIFSLLQANGFTIIRKRKHLVWSNGKIQVVTAASPSDRRAYENIKAILRRALA